MTEVFLNLAATLFYLSAAALVILIIVKFAMDFKESTKRNRRVKQSMNRIETEQERRLKEELKKKVEEKRNEKKDCL